MKIVEVPKMMMIKALTVSITVFSLSLCVNAQSLSTAVSFEERVHNFGTILEKNGKVSHTFVFRNTGKSDVTIADVQSACGCIGKVITKGPVKPGGKGKVTITFDPGYKSGFFSKEIIVFSKGGKEFSRIWVEGTIKPKEHPVTDAYPYDFGNGLYLRLKVLAFGYFKPGETKQMVLHYANDTDKEMTLGFVAEGNRAGMKFTNPGRIGPRAKGTIVFSYTMPVSTGEEQVFQVRPYINNKKSSGVLEARMLREKSGNSTTDKLNSH